MVTEPASSANKPHKQKCRLSPVPAWDILSQASWEQNGTYAAHTHSSAEDILRVRMWKVRGGEEHISGPRWATKLGNRAWVLATNALFPFLLSFSSPTLPPFFFFFYGQKNPSNWQGKQFMGYLFYLYSWLN